MKKKIKTSPVSVLIGVAILGILIVILVDIISMKKAVYSSYSKSEDKRTESVFGSDEKEDDIKETPVTDNSMQDNSSGYEESTQDVPAIEIEGDATSIYVWPNQPTVSVYSNTVDEDEEFVYTLRCSGGSWEDYNNVPRGDIVRLNKADGTTSVMVSEGNQGSAYALSVMGDYLYYSVHNGSCFEYYRMNKNSGDTVLLFEEEYSFIFCYDSAVWCLFTRNGRHEIMRYDIFSGTQEYTDITADYSEISSEAFELFVPFSIFNGKVYFGGKTQTDAFYGVYTLDNGNTYELARVNCFEEFDRYEDGSMEQQVFAYNEEFLKIYGLRPFIMADESTTLRSSTAMSQDALLTNNRAIYTWSGEHAMVTVAYLSPDGSADYATDDDGEFVCDLGPDFYTGSEVFLVGTTSDWVITNGMAYYIDGESVTKTISLY